MLPHGLPVLIRCLFIFRVLRLRLRSLFRMHFRFPAGLIIRRRFLCFHSFRIVCRSTPLQAVRFRRLMFGLHLPQNLAGFLLRASS